MKWYDFTPPRAPDQVDFPLELAGDQRGYSPFIVLTTQRSGSSMLVQSLRAHPRIVSFGELFSRVHIGFNTPGFDNRNRRLQSWRNRHPAEFMRRMIFRGYDENIQAVGFKVFYAHLDRARLKPLRAYLEHQPGLRVLHLSRRNLLRMFLSRTIALRTGVWGISSPRERSRFQVRLKPAHCRTYFETLTRQRAEYDRVFAANQRYDVAFETMVADFSGQMTDIQRFLAVDPTDLPQLTLRQEVRPLSEAILNYDALKREFAGTRWAELFDD